MSEQQPENQDDRKNPCTGKFAWTIFRRFPSQVILISVCSLIAAIFEILSLGALLPIFFSLFDPGGATDQGLIADVMDRLNMKDIPLVPGLTFIIVLMFLRGVLLFTGQYQAGRIAARITEELRNALMEAFLKVKWNFHTAEKSGKIINVIARETLNCASAVKQLGQIVSSGLMAALLLSASILASWQAFIIFIISCIPYFAFVRWANRKTHQLSTQGVGANNAFLGHMQNNLVQAKYIKTNAVHEETLEPFRKETAHVSRYALISHALKSFVTVYPEVFGILTLAIMLGVVYTYSSAPPGDILLFLLLLYRAYAQVSRFQNARNGFMIYVPSYEICTNYLDDLNKNEEPYDGRPFDGLGEEGIRCEHLTVAYNEDTPALNDVSLTIPKNRLTALVGRSGAGKTTLIDAAIGLVKPHAGEIYLGKDRKLSETGLESYRRKISYVPQENLLFSGTIRHNILLGAEDKSDENLRTAARAAQVDGFAEAAPQGYDTVVADLGATLSGGQKQRILLARALARKPEILILDEATSALDTETERLIHDTIISLRDKMTVILIAHRFSTVRHADVIHVLENGKLAETGTYDELVKKKGAFFRLLQAGER